MSPSTAYRMHVISHTHWDREWYLPFQQFRMRLVDLIDNLLDLLERNDDFAHFHLDGQTIVLEDYLEIRPENQARLEKCIREGRILIGPWYLLCDEFLVSGEAIVRNLLLGDEICRQWGAKMAVGYLPDQFGHISQMPQILQGFGLDNAIVARGISLGGATDKTEFWWEAPDGTRVLTHFMAFWYNNAQHFPRRTSQAVEFVRGLRDKMKPYATTRHLLLMNGCDHLQAQEEVAAIIKRTNAKLGRDRLIHSTLPDFMEALRREKPRLRTVKGELRDKITRNLLGGTLSTHVELKIRNRDTLDRLEGITEPLCAMSWLVGGRYDRAMMRHAWKLVLQNHPHDSICGCSIEQVHKEMIPRFDQACQIADELAERAMAHLAARIDTAGAEGTYPVVLFNALPWPRREVARLVLDFPADDHVLNFTLEDEKGKPVAYQLLGSRSTMRVVLSPNDLPRHISVNRYEIAAEVEMPAAGYKVLYARPSAPDRGAFFKPAPSRLSTDPAHLENEFLHVAVNPNGTIDITDKRTGRVLRSCLLFEDGGDAGNSYDYARPLRDLIVTSAGCAAEIRTVHRGEQSATTAISNTLRVPKELRGDRTGRMSQHHGACCDSPAEVEALSWRSEETVELPITSYVTVKKGCPRVEVRTVVDNTARDHRLRVLFPSGISRATVSCAEGAFDVVERPIAHPPADEQPFFTPTHPNKGFVDVSDGHCGLAILNKGLEEYEVVDDSARTIALTLLRCTAAVFGLDWTQKGNAAQIPGRHVFEYAIYPHEGDWSAGGVPRQAREFSIPLRWIQTDSHEGDLPPSRSVLAVEPPAVAVTAIKRCRDREGLIVRLCNLSPDEVEAKLRLGFKIARAHLCNLAEERQAELRPTRGRMLTLPMAGRKIATVEIIPEQE